MRERTTSAAVPGAAADAQRMLPILAGMYEATREGVSTAGTASDLCTAASTRDEPPPPAVGVPPHALSGGFTPQPPPPSAGGLWGTLSTAGSAGGWGADDGTPSSAQQQQHRPQPWIYNEPAPHVALPPPASAPSRLHTAASSVGSTAKSRAAAASRLHTASAVPVSGQPFETEASKWKFLTEADTPGGALRTRGTAGWPQQQLTEPAATSRALTWRSSQSQALIDSMLPLPPPPLGPSDSGGMGVGCSFDAHPSLSSLAPARPPQVPPPIDDDLGDGEEPVPQRVSAARPVEPVAAAHVVQGTHATTAPGVEVGAAAHERNMIDIDGVGTVTTGSPSPSPSLAGTARPGTAGSAMSHLQLQRGSGAAAAVGDDGNDDDDADEDRHRKFFSHLERGFTAHLRGLHAEDTDVGCRGELARVECIREQAEQLFRLFTRGKRNRLRVRDLPIIPAGTGASPELERLIDDLKAHCRRHNADERSILTQAQLALHNSLQQTAGGLGAKDSGRGTPESYSSYSGSDAGGGADTPLGPRRGSVMRGAGIGSAKSQVPGEGAPPVALFSRDGFDKTEWVAWFIRGDAASVLAELAALADNAAALKKEAAAVYVLVCRMCSSGVNGDNPIPPCPPADADRPAADENSPNTLSLNHATPTRRQSQVIYMRKIKKLVSQDMAGLAFRFIPFTLMPKASAQGGGGGFGGFGRIASTARASRVFHAGGARKSVSARSLLASGLGSAAKMSFMTFKGSIQSTTPSLSAPPTVETHATRRDTAMSTGPMLRLPPTAEGAGQTRMSTATVTTVAEATPVPHPPPFRAGSRGSRRVTAAMRGASIGHPPLSPRNAPGGGAGGTGLRSPRAVAGGGGVPAVAVEHASPARSAIPSPRKRANRPHAKFDAATWQVFRDVGSGNGHAGGMGSPAPHAHRPSMAVSAMKSPLLGPARQSRLASTISTRGFNFATPLSFVKPGPSFRALSRFVSTTGPAVTPRIFKNPLLSIDIARADAFARKATALDAFCKQVALYHARTRKDAPMGAAHYPASAWVHYFYSRQERELLARIRSAVDEATRYYDHLLQVFQVLAPAGHVPEEWLMQTTLKLRNAPAELNEFVSAVRDAPSVFGQKEFEQWFLERPVQRGYLLQQLCAMRQEDDAAAAAQKARHLSRASVGSSRGSDAYEGSDSDEGTTSDASLLRPKPLAAVAMPAAGDGGGGARRPSSRAPSADTGRRVSVSGQVPARRVSHAILNPHIHRHRASVRGVLKGVLREEGDVLAVLGCAAAVCALVQVKNARIRRVLQDPDPTFDEASNIILQEVRGTDMHELLRQSFRQVDPDMAKPLPRYASLHKPRVMEIDPREFREMANAYFHSLTIDA